MLTAEERSVVTRARGGGGSGGGRASRRALDPLPPDQSHTAYPAGASARTLGLLGRVDALLKAQPQPPRSALLRVLALLEEEREREAA